MDESANYISCTRPTAKQLWKPPVGVLELGIHGANNLLPMKTTRDNRGSTDAYCIVKYGPKWIRTRTIFESFNPRWNEQYTWEVFDPCTVVTIGVFDNRLVLISYVLSCPIPHSFCERCDPMQLNISFVSKVERSSL